MKSFKVCFYFEVGGIDYRVIETWECFAKIKDDKGKTAIIKLPENLSFDGVKSMMVTAQLITNEEGFSTHGWVE